MSEKENIPTSSNWFEWFDVRHREIGDWAFVLHRLTALGLVFYLGMHLIVLGTLALGPEGGEVAITVAFAHLCFNISGSIIWYPLRRVPIAMARKMAEVSTRSRKLAIIYLVVMFYVIPSLLILLAR